MKMSLFTTLGPIRSILFSVAPLLAMLGGYVLFRRHRIGLTIRVLLPCGLDR